MTISESLNAIVPRQVLGCCFSGNQRRMTAKLNRRKNIVAVITRLDGYLKRQIKNQTWHTFRLFQLGKFFSILAIVKKLFKLLPTLIFNTCRVGNKFHYAGLYLKRPNTSLLHIHDTLPTLNLLIKSHQSSR